jgi:hypothetical protein
VNTRHGILLFGAFFGALVAWAAVGHADRSEALSLPSESKIFYANGGRIMSVSPDGTGRVALTRKGRITGSNYSLRDSDKPYDRNPQISPNGSKVLFYRQDEQDDGYVSGLDGTTMVVDARHPSWPREVLPGGPRRHFLNATWMTGNRLLAVLHQHGKYTRESVVVAGFGGAVKRRILTLKHPRRRGRVPADWMPTQLSASPTGGKILIALEDEWENRDDRLVLVDLETGKRKLVGKGASQPEWSPDGKRITFVAPGSGTEVCPDDSSCRKPFDVFVANAQGESVRRVKATSYDEQSPSFSPDHRYISFSANVNRPAIDASREIYRMKSDGTCLDWITNGVPASRDPNWGPGAFSAPVCGITERQPLIESLPGQLDIKAWGPRMWLGEDHQGALVSSSFSFLGLSLIDYRECGEFRRADCPKPVMVAQAPVCLIGRYLPVALEALNFRKLRLRRGKIRGVGFRTGYFKGFSVSLVFTGQTVVALVRKSGGVRSGRLDQIALIRQLRALRGKAGGPLPAFRVPVSAIRESRRTRRAVRRHGLAKAAKRRDSSRWELRANMRLRANLRQIGPVRPMRCKSPGGIASLFGFGPVATDAGADRVLSRNVLRSLENAASGIEVPRVLTRSLP